MNKNWLKYFGFLGLLGLLGLFTSNVGFYGFFGFFGFFSAGKVKQDERFIANINKAAKNAFLVSLFVFIITTILPTIISNRDIFVYGFAINFALQMIIFTFSFQYYDRVGENID